MDANGCFQKIMDYFEGFSKFLVEQVRNEKIQKDDEVSPKKNVIEWRRNVTKNLLKT